MIDRAALSNPRTHYGSGKAATRGFVLQRLTGALNVAFTLFFVWFVVNLAGADRAHFIETVRNPGIAVILCLLIHAWIGVRNIFMDYIKDPALRLTLYVLVIVALLWYGVWSVQLLWSL